MSVPSKITCPEVRGDMRRRARPSVDLPQPDSPTRPSVSRSRTSKETPSTACTTPTCRRSTPVPCTGKCRTTSRACRSGSPVTSRPPRRSSSGGAARDARRAGGDRRRGDRRRPGRSAAAARSSARSGTGSVRRRRIPATSRRARRAPLRWPSAARAAGDRCAGSNRAAPTCTGAADRARIWRVVPCSTTRPAYITITRSATSATTPRSWVISTTADDDSRRSVRIRSRICAWMVTSSAVVGSSAISTRGLHERAIAIITRCRMPPENWCG